jgi:hypothetical protein
MFKVRRLRYQRDKIYQVHECKIDSLRKEKASSSTIASASFDQWVDSKVYENEISMVRSRRLLDEADAYDVAVPNDGGMWERDEDANDPDGPCWLSSQGRAHVRKLISEEKARRFEEKTQWVIKLIVPIIVALAGLVGAATGFVLALRK